MENFEELKKLIAEKEKIAEFQKRIKTIGYIGSYTEYIGIKNSDNSRFTFGGIAKIIGQEKLDMLVDQFEGLITVELFNAMQEKERQLSEFTIIKTK